MTRKIKVDINTLLEGGVWNNVAMELLLISFSSNAHNTNYLSYLLVE